MPNLTTASDIRFGTTPVDKVYLGTEQVWPVVPTATGLIQQYSGIWIGTTMSVSLPTATNPSSTLALFVAGNTVVPTPSGWTARESQVNIMGHYLFTRAGGANSWNITTNDGLGTWYIAEIGGAYETSASQNDMNLDDGYETLPLTPAAGPRLLVASLASVLDQPVVLTVDEWTGGFTEVADICSYPTTDNPMQGIAVRTVAADGITSYMTSALFAPQQTFGRSAIISSFIV